jgi:metallo-beta-lactamase family protein
MEIRFCGGAQEVTGSQFLLKINNKHILLECGFFQGRRSETYEKNQNFSFDPASVDALILSHAHMDHSGNIPNLVKKGFGGSIYATPPTVDLCKIMLKDSAFLQEQDIAWVNKIRRKSSEPPMEPFYTMAEAEAAMDSFVPKNYDETFSPVPGVKVTFRDAGHILGAASVLLEINEKGKPLTLGFTGDIGRPGMPIIRDPNQLRGLDALIMESTYGNRQHGSFDDVAEELAKTVLDVAGRGGRILIPSFAVGRTQLIVYLLHKLFNQNRIPEIPIFVDSPMATKATNVFRTYPEILDRETERVFLKDKRDPFWFRRLEYVTDVENSKRINGIMYPHIIISASGMMEGGRILHHLRNNIDHHRNLLLFVGFAARNTLARKIMEGEKKVKIFGEAFRVKCEIKVMDAFSAHADRKDLLNYVRITPPEKLRTIFLVHGEPDQSLSLRDALRSNGYMNVQYPELNQTMTL